MNEAPKWLVPIAIVAILWNLMGCAAYLMNAMITAEQIAALPPEQQLAYAQRPSWAVFGTALAVWLGALGSLMLALKKPLAMPVLVVSLLGIVIQDAWLFVLSDAASAAGAIAYVLQGLVLVIGIGLVALSVQANKSGWTQ